MLLFLLFLTLTLETCWTFVSVNHSVYLRKKKLPRLSKLTNVQIIIYKSYKKMNLTSCLLVRLHACCSHCFTIETNGESNILVCVCVCQRREEGLKQEGLMTLCVPGSLAQTITHVMRLGERARKGKARLAFTGAASLL